METRLLGNALRQVFREKIPTKNEIHGYTFPSLKDKNTVNQNKHLFFCLLNFAYLYHLQMGVSKNRGYPKMDGL